MGVGKPVFTANAAASAFLISLLFSVEPSLPYHFTFERVGWFCAWIKMGAISSNATKYTPTLSIPYWDIPWFTVWVNHYYLLPQMIINENILNLVIALILAILIVGISFYWSTLYSNPLAQRIKRQIEFRDALLRSFEQSLLQVNQIILILPITKRVLQIPIIMKRTLTQRY